jgi:UDP-N-acetylenolpyruvoylglucosamine reductase
MNNNRYKKVLIKFPGRIRFDEPMARYTTFKIGGPADLFFEAQTKQELFDICTLARKNDIPVFILGGGTNILISDKGVRGLVIKNSARHIITRAAQGTVRYGQVSRRVFVEAESGAIFNTLVRYTVDEGLSGLEMHLGLPGTVGGALYMNSKWTHPISYVGDTVYQAELLTSLGEVKIVPQQYFRFGYDSSNIQTTKDIVLTVTFSLMKDDKDRLWNIASESIKYRQATQPQGVFTAGCTFKNIPKSTVLSLGLPEKSTSAGFLIDHVGLKGVTVGDAQISPVHANFILNKGHASYTDVLELIHIAKEKVKKQFGVILEEEIRCVGEM